MSSKSPQTGRRGVYIYNLLTIVSFRREEYRWALKQVSLRIEMSFNPTSDGFFSGMSEVMRGTKTVKGSNSSKSSNLLFHNTRGNRNMLPDSWGVFQVRMTVCY